MVVARGEEQDGKTPPFWKGPRLLCIGIGIGICIRLQENECESPIAGGVTTGRGVCQHLIHRGNWPFPFNAAGLITFWYRYGTSKPTECSMS